MTSALDPARWPRRTFLIAGSTLFGSAAAGLAGCTAPGGPTFPADRSSTPVGEKPPGTGATAPPSAPPPAPRFPGSVEGAALESGLAGYAETVLTLGKKRLGTSGRALVTAVRDQHRAHVAALRTTDPTDPGAGPAAGTPSPSSSHSASKPSFTKAVDRLVTAESKAAAAHRARALASKGSAALLWGSLASSAAALSAILRAADLAGDDPDPTAARVGRVKARAPMPVVSVVRAEQEMVRQLHAIIYGYQLALGRLTGARRDTAAAELRRHRILRDRLTARLLNRKAAVPVAEPAYVPSTNPRNAATAAKLIRQMETALVPFCGLWLAATGTPAERTEALDEVSHTARTARHWGAAQPAWPGWKPF